MKKYALQKISTLLLFLSLVVIPSHPTSALTYQSSVDVGFTFNPTISLNLSGDLIINNLTPGTASDSNIIDVTVATNASQGYNLLTTVGVKGGTSSLVNSSNNSYTFTNLSTTPGTVSSLANFTDDTWGYSYSVDNGTNWISGSTGSTASGYAGLPLDNNNNAEERGNGGIALISTTNPADNRTIKFKIGAKASTEQASGTYTNTVNFYAVANPEPLTLRASYAAAGKTKLNGYYKLQDMNNSICENVEIVDEDSQMQVIDTRDNKVYWIAKLKDGHCWMTQNLDLNLSSNVTLTHADTDLGWGNDTATQSWTPDYSTIISDNGQISGYSGSSTSPRSVDPGDYYYAGYDGENLLPYTSVNYLTTTNEDYFKTTPYAINGTHGHVGNYYNWSAAVASNDTSGYTTGYSDMSNNPQNSICPAGWRLPTITNNSPNGRNAGSKDEFTRLAYLYSGHDGAGGMTAGDSTGMEATPLYFVRSGRYHYSVVDSGTDSEYLSSVMRGNYYIYIYESSSGRMTPGDANGGRNFAYPLRCLAR